MSESQLKSHHFGLLPFDDSIIFESKKDQDDDMKLEEQENFFTLPGSSLSVHDLEGYDFVSELRTLFLPCSLSSCFGEECQLAIKRAVMALDPSLSSKRAQEGTNNVLGAVTDMWRSVDRDDVGRSQIMCWAMKEEEEEVDDQPSPFVISPLTSSSPPTITCILGIKQWTPSFYGLGYCLRMRKPYLLSSSLSNEEGNEDCVKLVYSKVEAHPLFTIDSFLGMTN